MTCYKILICVILLIYSSGPVIFVNIFNGVLLFYLTSFNKFTLVWFLTTQFTKSGLILVISSCFKFLTIYTRLKYDYINFD